MKQEEKVTLDDLSFFSPQEWEKRRREEIRSEEWGRYSERRRDGGGVQRAEITLRHSSNIYQGSSIWFTASLRVTPTLKKTPQQLPRRDADRQTSQNQSLPRLKSSERQLTGRKTNEWQRFTNCTYRLTESRVEANLERHDVVRADRDGYGGFKRWQSLSLNNSPEPTCEILQLTSRRLTWCQVFCEYYIFRLILATNKKLSYRELRGNDQ